MQQTISIELRFDFADRDKLLPVRNLCLHTARTLKANLDLLGDGIKSQCAVILDDNFHPQEVIDLYEDLVATGEKALTEAGSAPEGDDNISRELIEALRDT